METIFGTERDIAYMSHALDLARAAAEQGEIPIGAVVVNSQGEIIGKGYNKVEQFCTQAAHAEIEALSLAGTYQSDWRMQGCWVYVTLEPCSMCISMILLSRVEGVVFGASSPVFGYQLDNDVSYQVYKKDALIVVSGVCKQESADLLKAFFAARRKK